MKLNKSHVKLNYYLLRLRRCSNVKGLIPKNCCCSENFATISKCVAGELSKSISRRPQPLGIPPETLYKKKLAFTFTEYSINRTNEANK